MIVGLLFLVDWCSFLCQPIREYMTIKGNPASPRRFVRQVAFGELFYFSSIMLGIKIVFSSAIYCHQEECGFLVAIQPNLTLSRMEKYFANQSY